MSDFVLDYRRCKWGHARTPENVQTFPDGRYKFCKKCRNDARRGKQVRSERTRKTVPLQSRVRRPLLAVLTHPRLEDCPSNARLLAAHSPEGIVYGIVDEDVFEEMHAYVWRTVNGYLVDGMSVYLHRLILGEAAMGWMVDHINGNTLDNRRVNLRLVTHGQNMQNRRGSRGAVSKYKGVSRDKGRWRAEIQSQGQRINLGNFATEEEAARAYDAASLKHHGQYGRRNFQ